MVSVPSLSTAALPISLISSPSGTSLLIGYKDFDSKNITGSLSLIEAANIETTSAELDGAAIFKPGIIIAQFSTA